MGRSPGLKRHGIHVAGSRPAVPLGCRGELNNTADGAYSPFAAASTHSASTHAGGLQRGDHRRFSRRWSAPSSDGTAEWSRHPAVNRVGGGSIPSVPTCRRRSPRRRRDRRDRYGAMRMSTKAERLGQHPTAAGKRPSKAPQRRRPAGLDRWFDSPACCPAHASAMI